MHARKPELPQQQQQRSQARGKGKEGIRTGTGHQIILALRQDRDVIGEKGGLKNDDDDYMPNHYKKNERTKYERGRPGSPPLFSFCSARILNPFKSNVQIAHSSPNARECVCRRRRRRLRCTASPRKLGVVSLLLCMCWPVSLCFSFLARSLPEAVVCVVLAQVSNQILLPLSTP